ncbi:hypothetical protein AB4144_67730, partial [Rhizobiaceae sp. 2RAB30]
MGEDRYAAADRDIAVVATPWSRIRPQSTFELDLPLELTAAAPLRDGLVGAGRISLTAALADLKSALVVG